MTYQPFEAFTAIDADTNYCSDKCTVCGLPVNLDDLHPDSVEVPSDGKWSVLHMGCANGEDAHNGFASPSLTQEDFEDGRGWIKTF